MYRQSLPWWIQWHGANVLVFTIFLSLSTIICSFKTTLLWEYNTKKLQQVRCIFFLHWGGVLPQLQKISRFIHSDQKSTRLIVIVTVERNFKFQNREMVDFTLAGAWLGQAIEDSTLHVDLIQRWSQINPESVNIKKGNLCELTKYCGLW